MPTISEIQKKIDGTAEKLESLRKDLKKMQMKLLSCRRKAKISQN